MAQIPQSNATSANMPTEALEIIREEQISLTTSSEGLVASKLDSEELKKDLLKCYCTKYDEGMKGYISPEKLDKILKENEAELRQNYEKILEREMTNMKEKFDLILSNEQIRTSFMLREAHRERQEKITALQSQLQCKNLAALMYVMCTERRRSRLEKLRIIRDYNDYIKELQNILTQGQQLILNLSRGYKTAARVDHEWREKMKKVIGEFLAFIYHFSGGDPETNQYLIDVPKLLKTEAPLIDNPEEDPCDEEEVENEQKEEKDDPVKHISREIPWWEEEGDCRPFVMFGDMSDFNPVRRREVNQHIKAAKTAPKKWKTYAFNEMSLNSACTNIKDIKDIYMDRLPIPIKWECVYTPSHEDYKDNSTMKGTSRVSVLAPHHATSVDMRGNMGSILKIITSVPNAVGPVSAKTELLGARDSLEITSATKVRERGLSLRAPDMEPGHLVKIHIGKKRGSIFDMPADEEEIVEPETSIMDHKEMNEPNESVTILGSIHVDSLQAMQGHIPEVDHKINYERVCPMEKCQRLQVDSFMRSLPPYMKANPFTHFEQTFDQYETCTPEQLEILKQRIEHKKLRETETVEASLDEPLSEWLDRGVAVQTSDMSFDLPPCTCHEHGPTPVSSEFVFKLPDLEPVKIAMDAIQRECFYDDRIYFDRFKLVGQDSSEQVEKEKKYTNKEFNQSRYNEIKKILKKHPSLLDIFQASVQ